MIQFLANHFWFTVLSVGIVVFTLTCAYFIDKSKEASLNQDSFFVSASSELDNICVKMDNEENTSKKIYKRGTRDVKTI